jgi:hypothetical protein
MIRKILGFAVIAIVALVVLKIALALLGVLVGLAVSVLVLAAMGYAFYLLVRVFSPTAAARIRDVVRGNSTSTL